MYVIHRRAMYYCYLRTGLCVVKCCECSSDCSEPDPVKQIHVQSTKKRSERRLETGEQLSSEVIVLITIVDRRKES